MNPSRTRALSTPTDPEDAVGAPDLVRAEARLARFRPTFAVIDLGRLAHNFRTLAARVGGDVAQIPVVKADGYGHGSIPVAQRLAAEGAHAFGVALVEEGVELRRAGLRGPILLLGILTPGQIPSALDHDLILPFSSRRCWRVSRRRAGPGAVAWS